MSRAIARRRGDKCARRRRGDEGTVSARREARVSRRASSRVRVVRVRDRDSGETRRARSRRSRRAPSVPEAAKVRRGNRDEGGFSRDAPRPVARGRRCRETYLGAAEAETALELGVHHAATAGDVLLVVGDVLVHALPAGHLDLHAVALAELGGGGAELVARDAADRAGLRRRNVGIRGEHVSAERVRIERDARVARARRRDAAPVSSHRGIFFSRQRPKPSKARSRSRAIARARSAPARTLATGTAMVLMVTADMMSFCCER